MSAVARFGVVAAALGICGVTSHSFAGWWGATPSFFTATPAPPDHRYCTYGAFTIVCLHVRVGGHAACVMVST